MPRPSDPHARARLLDAARAVFSDRGLDRAKVEDITTRAQLSKGGIRRVFTLQRPTALRSYRLIVDQYLLAGAQTVALQRTAKVVGRYVESLARLGGGQRGRGRQQCEQRRGRAARPFGNSHLAPLLSCGCIAPLKERTAGPGKPTSAE